MRHTAFFFLPLSPFLRHRRGIDDPDQATLACLRGGASKRLPHQQRQPIPALTQAIQQSHIGNVDKAD
ncbi:hypothetical protein [Bradyrhizobium centrolobii]|uniref:hypothetical protein n=1 Tax=Bradyrhizobium centrolobii TaxID=1505087 RepID=UPI0013747C78|nr:hypothetical protein [Bradyrhizobium centrolobii]